MTQAETGDAAAGFGPLRPTLMRVAYRMLGSVSDAEDVVQEAFIRWMGTDRSQVREPEAFLRRTVTRLCLDQLKSARRQRETYIGPWLPEPVLTASDQFSAPAKQAELHESISMAFLTLLEELSPLERAVFLLREGAEEMPSAALTRWRVTSAPSDGEDDWGAPTFTATLTRNRLGPGGCWTVSWDIDHGLFRQTRRDQQAPHLGRMAEAASHRPDPAGHRIAV